MAVPPDPRPIVPWPECGCLRVGFSGLIWRCVSLSHFDDRHVFRTTGERVDPSTLPRR
jgi:hypothetical protein